MSELGVQKCGMGGFSILSPFAHSLLFPLVLIRGEAGGSSTCHNWAIPNSLRFLVYKS